MTTANIPPEIRAYLGGLSADTRAALAAELAPNPQAEAAAAMRAMRAGDISSPADTDDMGGRPSIFGDNDDDTGLTRRERAANAIRDFFSRGDRAPSDPVTAVDELRAQGLNITHDPTGASY